MRNAALVGVLRYLLMNGWVETHRFGKPSLRGV